MEIVTNEIGKFAKNHEKKASLPRQRRSNPAARQLWTSATA